MWICSLALLSGCGGAPETSIEPDAGRDLDAGRELDAAPVAPDAPDAEPRADAGPVMFCTPEPEPFEDRVSPRGVLGACCAIGGRTPPSPIEATLIDLSSIAAPMPGSCGPYRAGFGEVAPPPGTFVTLPASPDAYPLRVRLPALTGADPECATTCGEVTAFGVAIEVPYEVLGDGAALAVFAPPPWRVVSGGCGEACAWPCLEGYQEYGVASCITLSHGSMGLATHDPFAPSVDVIIERRPRADDSEINCCSFGP